MIPALRILVVRRDNIGDLICTTPLLRGLREKFPEATIAVLASSYNAEVLRGNPDVNEIHIFLKRGQKSHGHGRLAMLWSRWLMARRLRKRGFDHIILANGGWRYAQTLGGKQMIGFREPGQPDNRQPDLLASPHAGVEEHEVSKMARLGAVLRVEEAMGPTWLFPEEQQLRNEKARLDALGWDPSQPSVAFHISSRMPRQRWGEDSFVALAKELIKNHGLQILLLWSPGEENSAMHPGDDKKAVRILRDLEGLPVFPSATRDIRELVASMSFADQVICSDGGAMHIAAALKKPILCFFGPSHVKEWHPWGVPYTVIQKPEVADITVGEALEGYARLQQQIQKNAKGA